MSATVPVYVKVVKTYEEWVEVSAVTISDAVEETLNLDGVITVIGTQYEPPESEEDEGWT